MEFSDLMKEFGAKVGIPDFVPDAENVCRVDIDGMSIAFLGSADGDTLVTWAEVSDPPPEGVSMLYRVLMESMFMGRGTGGSSFSVESESGKIFLHRVDPLKILDLDSFSQMLEKFVNTLELWRKMIADFRPVAEAVKEANAEAEQVNGFGMNGFMQV